MVRITADNMIAATRFANNIVFTNIEAAKALMPQLKDNAKGLLRLSENAAKSFEQTSRRALTPD
ncbi:MAG: hypothetical protein WCF23_05245 [Candidatus Nitrosopolaris sp.]